MKYNKINKTIVCPFCKEISPVILYTEKVSYDSNGILNKFGDTEEDDCENYDYNDLIFSTECCDSNISRSDGFKILNGEYEIYEDDDPYEEFDDVEQNDEQEKLNIEEENKAKILEEYNKSIL